MPRINQSIIEETVDENGVVKKRKSNQVLTWGDEPAYVKLYLKDLMYLADMPKQYAELTMALLKRVSYAGDVDGLCVTLVSRTKKTICEELGWKNVSSLDNALQKLLKGKILFRIDRGIFRMNPNLFGRGDWQDISRLRMEIGYDISGKSFSTICEYAEKEAEKAKATKEKAAETESKTAKEQLTESTQKLQETTTAGFGGFDFDYGIPAELKGAV